MRIYSKVAGLREIIEKYRELDAKIGFAPTMGALHEGHMSLVRAINLRKEISVVSIFVNPTQFNEISDLEKYPRSLQKDLILLEENGCDVVFIPTVADVYPQMLDTSVDLDLGSLAKVMEGAHRPGHFEGMMEVVNRLLHIVKPDKLYVGQKDFQQYTILRQLCDKLHTEIQVIICPIIREETGLALSSRNARLTEEWKQKALVLFQSLKEAQKSISKVKIEKIQQQAEGMIRDAGLKLEYFQIVDGITLEPLIDEKKYKIIVACLAAWAGDVRLIDNMILFDNYHTKQ